MIDSFEKRNKVIKSTDLDALSCQFSANKKGYYEPPNDYILKMVDTYSGYLQYFTGYSKLSAIRTIKSIYSDNKLPIINRGTYLRTKLIDIIIEEFLNEFGTCQIVSLGGGMDTRCFRVLRRYEAVKYIEVDFPEMAKLKKLAILENADLRKIVKCSEAQTKVNSKEDFERIEQNLDTPNYHLVGLDLREIERIRGEFDLVDTSLPTLILSECAMCYMNKEDNEKVIHFFCNKFGSNNFLCFLNYEPMSLNDSFGSIMASNLQNQGIYLETFSSLPDLSERYSFLSQLCGLNNVKLTDLSDIGGYDGSRDNHGDWLDEKEILRVNKLELIDEVEEIRLLLKHYCLSYAEFGSGGVFLSINKHHWIINGADP